MPWQRHSLWCRLVHGLRVGLFMLRLNNGEAAFGLLFLQGFRVPKGSLGHTLRQFLAMLMMPNTENDMALYPCRQQLLKTLREADMSNKGNGAERFRQAHSIHVQQSRLESIADHCRNHVPDPDSSFWPQVSSHSSQKKASLSIVILRFRSQPSVLATATCAVHAFSLQGIEGIPGICHCFRR